MASLLELAWTANASGRRADVLEAVVEAAAALVEDGFALVWLVSGERLVLRAAAGRLRHAHGGRRTDFARGEGLVGATAAARDIWVLPEPADDPRVGDAEFLRTEGVRGFIGVPLGARYALEGVLGVFSRRADLPDAAALEQLGLLASQTALALESARLFADSERRRRVAEALAAVGQALAHSLDPREVSHLIADSVLALLVDGQPIGALGAAAGRGRVFDAESRRLLEAFADQAAVALNNARLFAAERQARADAQALERRFHDLVNGVDAILTELELPGRRVLFVNGRVEPMLGYTPRQWMTEPDFWRRHIHPTTGTGRRRSRTRSWRPGASS